MRTFFILISLLLIPSHLLAATLTNNSPIYNLSASADNYLSYTVDVPAGASNLAISISGGNGDADLYVLVGSPATLVDYDCRPYLSGNSEQCNFAAPVATTYFIMLHAYNSFTGLTLKASYAASAGGSDSGGTSAEGATWSGFSDYYQDAIGLSGDALKDALQEAAARNQERMTYSEVWDALKYTDEDPNNSNNVILLYTGRSQAKSFNASGNSDQDAWNREHSWPKSHGFPSSSDWGYTDIHHLSPADASVNTTRSNKDYDNGGSSISEAPGNYSDGDSFEPRNQIKGDVARMMFYMDVRYNGNDSTGVEDLVLVNYTGTSGAALGKLCTLLAWHNQDPVDAAEIERHTRVVEWQGNRNPFIDYPEWANTLWANECN